MRREVAIELQSKPASRVGPHRKDTLHPSVLVIVRTLGRSHPWPSQGSEDRSCIFKPHPYR
eukprot:3310789-Pyramimonas_sp.AAC.1